MGMNWDYMKISCEICGKIFEREGQQEVCSAKCWEAKHLKKEDDMKVNINAVQFKADKKLENFIEKKVEKLSGRYEGVIGSEVTLRVEKSEQKNNKITEIRLEVRGYDLYAKKQSSTFEESTDTAVEALKKQLEKYKDKMKK